MLYKKIFRPALFRATGNDPEIAHEWAIEQLRIIGADKGLRKIFKKFCRIENGRLNQKVFGLHFPNPVGLAAGFDKNGQAINGLASLGFGFITAGTVTPFEQKGNDRPRIFRLPEDRALINRMGFNNSGAAALRLRLSAGEKQGIPIGASIGKMKDTPNENSINDYSYCLRALYNFADYFEINVSSPNTAGLRALQRKNDLENLLMALNQEMAQLARRCDSRFKPIIPKIAPDLSWSELDDIIEACVRQRIMGLAVANTTTGRDGLKSNIKETGGLSGEPLREKALNLVRYISKETKGTLPIIGAGGIFTAEDAFEMLKAGASLVQILTGLVYEGPLLARKINRGLVKIFEKEGIGHISEINWQAQKENIEPRKCFVTRRRGCQPTLNPERKQD